MEARSASIASRWVPAAAGAGAVAGVIYGPVEMWLVARAAQASEWLLPHRISGMVIGPEIVAMPITAATVLAGWIVHMGLALAFGVAIVAPVRRAGARLAIPVGAAMGAVMYLLSYHLVAPVLFPWMLVAQGVHTLAMHLVFGVLTILVYLPLRRRLAGR